MTAIHEQILGPSKRSLDRLMGSAVDAFKLVSSMTLFAEIAEDARMRDTLDVDTLQKMAIDILDVARGGGYPACEYTRRALRAS